MAFQLHEMVNVHHTHVHMHAYMGMMYACVEVICLALLHAIQVTPVYRTGLGTLGVHFSKVFKKPSLTPINEALNNGE